VFIGSFIEELPGVEGALVEGLSLVRRKGPRRRASEFFSRLCPASARQSSPAPAEQIRRS